MARSIFCSGFKRKERHGVTRTPREEPPPNGAFMRARSPAFSTLSNLKSTLNRSGGLFEYPVLKLSGAKSALSAWAVPVVCFSSQAPYPFIFLGGHNKERECQETTHTPHFWKVRDRQGAPIDVKTWLHWTGTTICRLLPLVPRLLVECVPGPCSSLVADRVSFFQNLSRFLIRASHLVTRPSFTRVYAFFAN